MDAVARPSSPPRPSTDGTCCQGVNKSRLWRSIVLGEDTGRASYYPNFSPMNTPEQPKRRGHDEMFDAFFESVKNNPDKARRYHNGWLNVIAANAGRSADRKWRLEDEAKRRSWN